MKERLLAVLGAMILIVGALALRASLAGGSDGEGKGSSTGSGGLPVVACTDDLMAYCDALATAGVIAKDPPTLDGGAASAPDKAIDGWITWDPAPDIADYDAPNRNAWTDVQVLGSARQAVLADESLMDARSATCRSKPTWMCLTKGSDGLAFGVGDPATAEGIARLAPVARTFADGDDYETLDVDGLRKILNSPPADQRDAGTQAKAIVTTLGSLDLVTGPNDLLADASRTERGKGLGLRVLSPSPASRLAVVLATRSGGDLGKLAKACDAQPKVLTAQAKAVGLQPCEGTRSNVKLAGFLYQVRKKVG